MSSDAIGTLAVPQPNAGRSRPLGAAFSWHSLPFGGQQQGAPSRMLASSSAESGSVSQPVGGGAASAARPLPTILVADDDRLIVATLSRGLRDAGFSVIEVYDSTSALEACLRDHPTVAILDFKMPGMTGAELARSIAAQTSVPIVFLSGYSDDSIVREAVEAGAMSYLVKPIDIGQLLPVIRSAVGRAQDLQRLRVDMRTALNRNRAVSIATGLLMSRFHITQKEAFERLRRHARSTRAGLEEVAEALLRATEEAAVLYEKLAAPLPGSKSGPPRKLGGD